jgi:hypothetical protein
MIDAGVSIDADDLVDFALGSNVDAIAISTYNGVGLDYMKEVIAALAARGADLPILIGGKLNAIPDTSNSSLPVDITDQLSALGALPCATLDDMMPVLRNLSSASARVAE